MKPLNSMVNQTMESGAMLSELKLWPYSLSALWLWENYLTLLSPSVSLFVQKGGYEDEMTKYM